HGAPARPAGAWRSGRPHSGGRDAAGDARPRRPRGADRMAHLVRHWPRDRPGRAAPWRRIPGPAAILTSATAPAPRIAISPGPAFTISSRLNINCRGRCRLRVGRASGPWARRIGGVFGVTAAMSPNGFPALVLNADFRPLSYYPLSLWSWQDAIK